MTNPTQSKLSVIVLTTADALPFLQRTLDSLQGLALIGVEIHELVIVWSTPDNMVVELKGCAIPHRVVPLLYAQTWDVQAAVQQGIAASSGEWLLVLHAGEQIAPPDHVAQGTSYPNGTGLELHQLLDDQFEGGGDFPSADAVIGQLTVFWTEDAIGHRALSITSENRLIRKKIALMDGTENRLGALWLARGFEVIPVVFKPDAPAVWSSLAESISVHLPILRQSLAGAYYETGADRRAMEVATGSRLDRRYYVKARARIETNEALQAFERLFHHMSLNEELWRLEQIMRLLPFDLEQHPRMGHFRELLRKQIGHLDSIRDWYAEGSPGEVVDTNTILNPPVLTPRLLWLIQECRRRGHKRVLEMGSVDGFNLFQLQHAAPEIEWHGVEVSKKAVEHGHLMAKQTGKSINLHHVESLADAVAHGPFDAVAVFEVLEHNREPWGILQNAIWSIVRRGHSGYVYVSTPDGNWSAYDDNTRSVELRKDHINVYTVNRMRETLAELADDCARSQATIDEIQVFSVENPFYWEANGWVFASFRVTR